MPPQQQNGELLQAYGHPKTAFLHLFWKVYLQSLQALPAARPQEQTHKGCLQAAAVLVYIFCGIFSSSFIVNFVVIVLLLTLDFWTVRSALPLP